MSSIALKFVTSSSASSSSTTTIMQPRPKKEVVVQECVVCYSVLDFNVLDAVRYGTNCGHLLCKKCIMRLKYHRNDNEVACVVCRSNTRYRTLKNIFCRCKKMSDRVNITCGHGLCGKCDSSESPISVCQQCQHIGVTRLIYFN